MSSEWDVGILEFGSRPSRATPVGAALRQIVAYAQDAEASGYSRFWIAEHHTPYAAETSPELLTMLVASQTERIRVGSGGVLLPYYSPLKVAESFRILEALFPGRIDLGICRGPGVAAPVQAEGLVWGATDQLAPARFAQKAAHLVQFLGDGIPAGSPFHGAHAYPVDVPSPEIWILATGVPTIRTAAELGVSMCFGHFLLPPNGPSWETVADVLDREYVKRFNGGPRGAIARRGLAVSVLAAPTEALAVEKNDANARRGNMRCAIVGTPAQCQEKLAEIAKRVGTRSLILSTTENEPSARIQMYRDLADAFGLDKAARA